MWILELCVVVFAPMLIFVIVAQRIPHQEQNQPKRARFKGRFAED